jgi:hypothetical protein
MTMSGQGNREGEAPAEPTPGTRRNREGEAPAEPEAGTRRAAPQERRPPLIIAAIKREAAIA